VDEHRDDPDRIRLPGVGRTVSTRILMVAAVLVAALLRVAWAVHYGLSIEMEGTEYGRIAENLLNGRGYVGMFNNGTHTGFPPLYPFMIAAVSYVLGNTEYAERLINIACGAALVVPMFAIGKRLYGQRVAVGLAALVVFHPVLIAVGASTYSEGPYLLLLMSALLWFMKWTSDGRLGSSLAAGMFFGLAYLIRPESFLLVGVFAACGLLVAAWTRNLRATWGPVGLVAAFFLVALPYVVFLAINTGKVRLETKGPVNYLAGQRINAGMSVAEAFTAIGDNLDPQGVFVRPTLDVVNLAPPSLKDYLSFFLKSAPRNFQPIARGIVDQTAVGSPFLFALVVLGLFRRGWDRQRIVLDGILLITAGIMLAVLLMVPPGMLLFRYFYPLLGILLIWGAKGADELYEWARTSTASLVETPRIGELAGGLIKWGSIAVVLIVALRATPYLDQFRESQFPERARAGHWLAKQPPVPALVMDTGMYVAYYAGANFSALPYTRSDVALRYIAKLKPDFIVLHSLSKADLPYAEQWFDDGIPDKRAVLVYNEGAPSSSPDASTPKPTGTWQDEIKVYRWVSAGS
jgi:4-amino-4-deoxy-L-arabinose transferase-like glycosyltransferase